jgi:hypothetical protein
MTRLTALALIALQLVVAVPRRAAADDSDIFGANIQPNVVFIIDNSGSMDDDAPSNAYDPSFSYSQLQTCDPVTTRRPRTTTYSNCVDTKVYNGSGGDYSTYANTIANVNKASARTALTQSGYWSGSINGSTVNLFTGNYINYLLGTCASGGACNEKKMVIAQRVVNSVLDNVSGVRFGIMTFYYGSGSVRGARVVAQVGTAVNDEIRRQRPDADERHAAR